MCILSESLENGQHFCNHLETQRPKHVLNKKRHKRPSKLNLTRIKECQKTSEHYFLILRGPFFIHFEIRANWASYGSSRAEISFF